MLCALYLVGLAGPELHVAEAHELQHPIPCGLRELQVLVLVVEVGLQRVDALETYPVGVQVPAVWRRAAETGEALHQVVAVGQEVDRVAVRLGSVAGKVIVADVELTGNQGIAGGCRGKRLYSMGLKPRQRP